MLLRFRVGRVEKGTKSTEFDTKAKRTKTHEEERLASATVGRCWHCAERGVVDS